MKQKAIFYHAGCPVCVAAEQSVVDALDRNRFDVEEVLFWFSANMTPLIG